MTIRLLTYLAESGPRAGILAGEIVYDVQALTGKTADVARATAPWTSSASAKISPATTKPRSPDM